jgi:hypothetical protein
MQRQLQASREGCCGWSGYIVRIPSGVRINYHALGARWRYCAQLSGTLLGRVMLAPGDASKIFAPIAMRSYRR